MVLDYDIGCSNTINHIANSSSSNLSLDKEVDMQNSNYEPQIGDWIIPSDDIIDGIAYGYNKRLIIGISEDKEEFTTVCDSFDIEKGLWNIYNTEFVARVVLE